MRSVMRGWRFFKCDSCGTTWKESCRDYQTSSGSICPKCHEFEHPYDGEPDESLETDGYGNLAEDSQETVILEDTSKGIIHEHKI